MSFLNQIHGADGGSCREFDEFVQDTSFVMRRVVDSIVGNSKLGMELVDLTENNPVSRQQMDQGGRTVLSSIIEVKHYPLLQGVSRCQ